VSRNTGVNHGEPPLPLRGTELPADGVAVRDIVRQCFERDEAIYPLGGRSGLSFGTRPAREGVGLSLAQLSKVVDFDPARRFVRVQAGVTIAQLGQVLREAQQRLPIDVPQPAVATVGGSIAANANGPRRYACRGWSATLQSLQAVDGLGQQISAQGPIGVFDFRRNWLGQLLTGSLGCLAVITEVTLRTEPVPPRLAGLCCAPRDLQAAEELLAALACLDHPPVAIELLCGGFWSHVEVLSREWDRATDLRLAVAFEGTDTEVAWAQQRLQADWAARGTADCLTLDDTRTQDLIDQVVGFSAIDGDMRLLRASLLPAGVTRFIAEARNLDSRCSLQAHAGSGVVNVRLSEKVADPVPSGVMHRLRKAAARTGGSVTPLTAVLAKADSKTMSEVGHAATWDLVRRLKSEFDPKHLLNPGRFL